MCRAIIHVDIEACFRVLREGYTDEKDPPQTLTHEELQIEYYSGHIMYGGFVGGELVRFLSFRENCDSAYELRRFAVLPECRGACFEEELRGFAEEKVAELNEEKIVGDALA